ncbi:MAG TPA: hypothetical protein VNM92_04030 [Thermoanaerobaculia bacterium]|nr:hypothetical protein [Thermoanaerobaculia bacterium]
MTRVSEPLGEKEAHDLRLLGELVRREYFPAVTSLSIRWGQQRDRRRQRSIRLGSYNHKTAEIRIHPRLNRKDVPSLFIQSIIHHEYLHHMHGSRHDRHFHQMERRFRGHKEARAWLRGNLKMLLKVRTTVATVPRPVAVPLARPFLQLFLF